uniref:Transposase Tc1-like domain-containing protein n=1 Tax=Paramormyrops kingsleyae TaxID=1676925 RepID=A0A3B3QAJ8_9TELE
VRQLTQSLMGQIVGSSVTKTAKHRQTVSAKRNRGHRSKLTDRQGISIKTVNHEPHKAGIYGRAAIQKPLLSKASEQKHITWCKEHRTWTPEQWESVTWSDEPSVTLFLQLNGRVPVCPN